MASLTVLEFSNWVQWTSVVGTLVILLVASFAAWKLLRNMFEVGPTFYLIRAHAYLFLTIIAQAILGLVIFLDIPPHDYLPTSLTHSLMVATGLGLLVRMTQLGILVRSGWRLVYGPGNGHEDCSCGCPCHRPLCGDHSEKREFCDA